MSANSSARALSAEGLATSQTVKNNWEFSLKVSETLTAALSERNLQTY